MPVARDQRHGVSVGSLVEVALQVGAGRDEILCPTRCDKPGARRPMGRLPSDHVEDGIQVDAIVQRRTRSCDRPRAKVAVVFDEGEQVEGWTLCSPDADEIVEALKVNGVV